MSQPPSSSADYETPFMEACGVLSGTKLSFFVNTPDTILDRTKKVRFGSCVAGTLAVCRQIDPDYRAIELRRFEPGSVLSGPGFVMSAVGKNNQDDMLRSRSPGFEKSRTYEGCPDPYEVISEAVPPKVESYAPGMYTVRAGEQEDITSIYIVSPDVEALVDGALNTFDRREKTSIARNPSTAWPAVMSAFNLSTE